MPLGHEELYSDPDWPEYEAIAGPRASAEGFLQFKANKPPGASYPKGQNIGGPHDSTLEELMLTTPPGQQFAGQVPGMGVMERPGGGKRGGRGGSGGGGGTLRDPRAVTLAQNFDPYGSVMDADANAMYEYAKMQNTQAPLPEPQDDRSAVLMELLKKYGMERDYHGGNIRPTDFGDESEEFGDEGMDYPGRPDYYAPVGKGHTPVWHPSSELPPLSPELMQYQMTQNPPKAKPTERVPEDDDLGLGDTLDAIGSRVIGGDYMDKATGDEFLMSPEGKLVQDIFNKEGGPTDTAVEQAESLFTQWYNKNQTVPNVNK